MLYCKRSRNLIHSWHRDIYKIWTRVHGPPDGPGPWTTPWTRSMDSVHGPPHGPPLLFKRKLPLLIWKFTRSQGMKNTDYYSLLMSLKVCLVIEGCFGIASQNIKHHKLVLRCRRSSAFWLPTFSFQQFQIVIWTGTPSLPPPPYNTCA